MLYQAPLASGAPALEFALPLSFEDIGSFQMGLGVRIRIFFLLGSLKVTIVDDRVLSD